MSKISVWRAGSPLTEHEGGPENWLYYNGEYRVGDELVFETTPGHHMVWVDPAISSARVYLPTGRMVYRLPLDGDNPVVYPPAAFVGEKHVIAIWPAEGNEYRNLAMNPADQRGEGTVYPHARANVETRNESVFCARNAIDGMRIADGHGEYPYQSWGIGARTDAEIILEFGRSVRVDAMALFLRADFPHDAYWIQGTVTLSDGYEQTFPLKQLDGKQLIPLNGEHTVTWARLDRLIKCDMPSAFPALRQWEVYGTDC